MGQFRLAHQNVIGQYAAVLGMRAAAERFLGLKLSRYALERGVLRRSGILDDIWRGLAPGVYVFNYHRIGDATRTDFDPNVYSCDEPHFAAQVEFIAQRFRVIGIRDLIEGVLDEGRASEPLAMITFDDGYRDNFTGAFPILRSAGVPAAFFIPTGFVGTNQVPWWDEIAWMVRHTTKKSIEIPFTGTRLQLSGVPLNVAIRSLLTAFKRAPGDAAQKVTDLRRVLDCQLPQSVTENLFVSWDDLAVMRKAGMDIGSHTHSHQILSHLSPSEQLGELSRSKQLLEAHLGEGVDAIAYPVGAVDSFTRETMALTEQCGYKVGFSFINGANLGSDLPRFSMRRIAVEDNASAADLQYSTAFAGSPSVRERVLRHLARRFLG